MDDTVETEPRSGTTMGRRTFFGRVLLGVGATTGVLALSGCPGGEQDDDDDDGGDDD